VNESIAIQEDDENYKGPIIWDYENWNVIHGNDEYDKEFQGVNGTDSDGKQPGPLLCYCLVDHFFATLDHFLAKKLA
jgi:hypothetical protein